MVKTTPPKVQSSKVRKVNQGGTSSNKSVTRSPKIRSEHVSQSFRNINQTRASVAIKQKETSMARVELFF